MLQELSSAVVWVQVISKAVHEFADVLLEPIAVPRHSHPVAEAARALIAITEYVAVLALCLGLGVRSSRLRKLTAGGRARAHLLLSDLSLRRMRANRLHLRLLNGGRAVLFLLLILVLTEAEIISAVLRVLLIVRLLVNLGQCSALVRLKCLIFDLFALIALLELEFFLVALATRLFKLTIDLIIQSAKVRLLVD